MEDEQFRELIQEKRAGKAVADKQIDDTIERIEKNALDKIERLLPFENKSNEGVESLPSSKCRQEESRKCPAAANKCRCSGQYHDTTTSVDPVQVDSRLTGCRSRSPRPDDNACCTDPCQTARKKAERLVVDATRLSLKEWLSGWLNFKQEPPMDTFTQPKITGYRQLSADKPL